MKAHHKKTEDLPPSTEKGIDEDSIHLDNVQSPDNCQKGPDGTPECFFDETSERLEGHVGVGNTPEKCDENDTSGLPAKVFEGMYGKFCETVTTNPVDLGLWWFVDVKGNKFITLRRDLEKRSPPVSAGSYPDARSYLTFEKDGDKACKMSCSEAFDTLIQGSCAFYLLPTLANVLIVHDNNIPLGGHAGGDQSSMAKSGHIDAGCGTYSYAAYSEKDNSKPKTPSGLEPDNN